ncbi:hypothetical protein NQ317_008415 [Molorchus minor]|uniref:HAUS augmin-like complex subunit 6 N-terminal domain-containing protein n=1 Tax=Molorchus minor TaxID=1323400 RepID=A0ABQ9JIR8_9CUCU|nr:hypothetical protein NQ317_008415 [Molorchus minor]
MTKIDELIHLILQNSKVTPDRPRLENDTMADLKQYKENESRIHEQLYDNVFLLSHFYPTSKELNAVFKKDMFIKNNKTAFFEVIYYLLTTLNTELTKQRITTWPPYEIKRENKFRAEVLKYINELNTLYDNADIPHIMSSHLISPGGLKFAKFMLKLSQLVVYEHLKKMEPLDVLYCPKPSKNIMLTKANIGNLKKKTALIENGTRELLNKFDNNHFQLNEEALKIDTKLNELNDKIRLARQKNTVIREEFNKAYPSYPSFESLNEKLHQLKTEWEHLQEIQNIFFECDQLITYLSSSASVLEHYKDELKIPNEVLHIVRNQDELDLKEFFHGLHILLEHKALELPNPTSSFIECNLQQLKELNEKYSRIKNSLSDSVQKIEATIEKLSTEIAELAVAVDNEDEEPLAVPLMSSDKSA